MGMAVGLVRVGVRVRVAVLHHAFTDPATTGAGGGGRAQAQNRLWGRDGGLLYDVQRGTMYGQY